MFCWFVRFSDDSDWYFRGTTFIAYWLGRFGEKMPSSFEPGDVVKVPPKFIKPLGGIVEFKLVHEVVL